MAIDDPISSVETIIENEERSASRLQSLVEVVLDALPDPVGAVARRAHAIASDRLDKQKLLIEVVVSELRFHARRIEELYARSAEFHRFWDENFRALVLDALKKAKETRSADRIRRIGRVLLNSLTVDPPLAADDVEELMRIAMALDDREVRVLGAIYQTQLPGFNSEDDLTASSDYWSADAVERAAGTEGAPASRGLVIAILAKLRSFGLVFEMPTFADVPNPHQLLRTGVRFVEFARSQVEPQNEDGRA